MRRLFISTLLIFCCLAPATQPVGKTLRVYHIGNSVTDTIRYAGLQQLAATRGDVYTFGRHMMPGTPLFGLWDNQDKGYTQEPFGPSIHALENFEWDILTLQPFDRLLEGNRESDFETCSRFIDLAIKKSPNVQIYIYQRWPKRDVIGKPKYDGSDVCAPIDYAEKWNRPYTGKWDSTYETRDYFDKLAARLNEAYKGKLAHEIRLVRVGDVLAKLDEKIREGNVPTISSINDIYADTVHLTDVGKYVVGLTFYATMFEADVRGLSTAGYAKIDPQLVPVLQECVMHVVGGE